jgi:hypothetical protein
VRLAPVSGSHSRTIRRPIISPSLSAALVFGLALGRCGGGEGDDPVDSGLPSKEKVTTSPTEASPTMETPKPTAPSEPSAPTLPAAASKPGRSGAKAFVKFYVDLENYARHTGDVDPLRTYSHPKCGGCDYFLRYYRALYDRGGWIKRGDRTITTFDRVVPATAPHDMYVRISGNTEAGMYKKRQGSPVSRGHGDSYTLLFWLVREPQGWLVSRLDTP